MPKAESQCGSLAGQEGARRLERDPEQLDRLGRSEPVRKQKAMQEDHSSCIRKGLPHRGFAFSQCDSSHGCLEVWMNCSRPRRGLRPAMTGQVSIVPGPAVEWPHGTPWNSIAEKLARPNRDGLKSVLRFDGGNCGDAKVWFVPGFFTGPLEGLAQTGHRYQSLSWRCDRDVGCSALIASYKCPWLGMSSKCFPFVMPAESTDSNAMGSTAIEHENWTTRVRARPEQPSSAIFLSLMHVLGTEA